MRLLLALILAVPAAAQLPAVDAQLNLAQRSLAALAARRAGVQPERLLRKALDRDADEKDRLKAVKGLRFHAPDGDAAYRVLEFLSRSNEESPDLRRRAVQSLGFTVGAGGRNAEPTLHLLAGLAEDPSVPVEVRTMALKALHMSTVNEEDARSWMIDWARTGPSDVLREAAIWSLASVATDDEASPLLEAAFRNPAEPLILRVQALKSLYVQAGRADLRDAAMDLARDARTPVELRETALLFLSPSSSEKAVERLLDGMSGHWDARLRNAAAKALEPRYAAELRVFFRLRYDPVLNRTIEVLELE